MDARRYPTGQIHTDIELVVGLGHIVPFLPAAAVAVSATSALQLGPSSRGGHILDNNWKDIPACVQIALNFCNVTSTKIHGNHAGCVMLRVQAERDGLTSIPVEACSSQGEPCTPQFSLTARPGSLTVHLSGDHSLAQEYGAHVKHRIYLGKKGESLKEHSDAASSLTIKELEEGQQYCAKVQYVTLLSNDTELSSCIQCESIPFSGESQLGCAQAHRYLCSGTHSSTL
uniref:Uncharacterized LOC114455582 n=1 Tax=Gouania willdenowi TaxID=441366 RepID=A0A8C5ECK9_GOUWI